MRHTHQKERGSALLIVFLFAALVAIMLYRELPSTVFEARRAKEQLLIDRGDEYVRAIQLYYRRFKPRYPPSLDALENTNRIRFLRHRFKDPFTGKDDWRLIHTNGLALIDSKVNPLKTPNTSEMNASGSRNSGRNSSSQWFTKSNSAFGSDSGFSSDSSEESSNEQPEVVVRPVPVRPPAIRAGGGAAVTGPLPEDANADPEASLLDQTQNAADLGSASQQPSGVGPAQQQSGSQQSGAANNPNPMQMVRNMLSSESPLAPQRTANGAVTGGMMIAGVASKAGGHTIKVIGDQTDYSLWEFVYDPTKDRTGTGTQGLPGQTGMPATGTRSPNDNGTHLAPGSTFSISGSGTITNPPDSTH